MNKAGKVYVTRFLPAMVLAGLLLVVVVVVLKNYPLALWRTPLVLLPLIPLSVGLHSLMHFLDQLDELQRRIQLEALATGCVGTVLLSFGYGLLQIVGFPALNWTFVLPLLTVCWGIGLIRALRRYR
jgi:hypothetical protein